MLRGLLLGTVLLAGCAAYSPPVRSLGYGAPGRLRQGDLEIGGGFAAAPAPAAGGGWLAYGVRDWVSIEAGADGSRGGWGMGFLGGRFTHAPRRERKLHGALDGEIGVGIGAGGSHDCPLDDTSCDRRAWHRRIAAGGYLGGGAGYHFSFFALYARARAQPTVADGLPFTLWGQAQGGMQFRIAKTVDLFGSAGIAGFVTGRKNDALGFVWDLGISVHFDPRGKRGRTTTWRGVRLRM